MVQTAVETNSFRQQSGREPGQTSKTFLRRGEAGGWLKELSTAALDRLEPEDQALLNHRLLIKSIESDSRVT